MSEMTTKSAQTLARWNFLRSWDTPSTLVTESKRTVWRQTVPFGWLPFATEWRPLIWSQTRLERES